MYHYQVSCFCMENSPTIQISSSLTSDIGQEHSWSLACKKTVLAVLHFLSCPLHPRPTPTHLYLLFPSYWGPLSSRFQGGSIIIIIILAPPLTSCARCGFKSSNVLHIIAHYKFVKKTFYGFPCRLLSFTQTYQWLEKMERTKLRGGTA